MDRRLLELDLKTSLTSLADFILPRVCVVCERQLIPLEKHICLECLADIPLTRFETRSRNPMADRLNAALPDEDVYSYATALFYYAEGTGYDHITKSLKYGRNFGAGRFFASMLAKSIAQSALYSDVDAVIPVPLHPLRKWKRGYNQAETIACVLAAELGTPCEGKILRRTRYTGSQTQKNGSERIANVKKAFRTTGTKIQEFRHILLVDDVMTTGATLSECHRTLRGLIGPGPRISVATLAFVE